MPLYESILSEKIAVVLDVGNAYTKCGFAGETGPRSIIRSEIKNTKTGEVTLMRNYKNSEDLLEYLKSFLYLVFYKHLLVNPKDRRIVIIESMLSPTVFRETLAKTLFQHFEVSSVLYAPSHLMSLFTLGLGSALVVDVGYTETLVIPIFEGVPMLCAWESLPLAGKAIHKNLRENLLKVSTVKKEDEPENSLTNYQDRLHEEVIEDIKVRTCFVSPYRRVVEQSKLQSGITASTETRLKSPCDVKYPLCSSTVLNIPGEIREYSAEVLFQQDNDMKSVSTLILDSLLKCSIDTRKTLAENIIVMGGTAMMPGFKHRLLTEVKNMSQEGRYSTRLAVKVFKVHSPPAKENVVAWLGGSIFSDKDYLAAKSVAKKEYQEQGSLPDWCNLKYNINENNNISL